MNTPYEIGCPTAQRFAPAHYPGLSGKVVLNTGGGSGIGRAMAHGFARHGANVMLLDIDVDGMATTKAELEAAYPGIKVDIVQASIPYAVALSLTPC
jgi:NAD(P)-dependent dehydrogenase (short-subunit alcohol dehydrogenase family)